ncbi:hypothetical protein E5676_scaffold1572G00180 [Cucumis melo var. makuwa]|uniref:Uncharacterized protein n=1 Tax=Cucumis melo var. makuwa TaxID=1194695 RepID=A0A5D3C5U8_CUCMM|nr:hypothetical protein E5676_scaffold1572G00180 [Cucumis melo var. makuwa]
MTELSRPPSGRQCLVLRCTHSCYENEMRHQLDSRLRLLRTRTSLMVEHSLAKAEVEGSSPSFCSCLCPVVLTSRVHEAPLRKRGIGTLSLWPPNTLVETKSTSRHREEISSLGPLAFPINLHSNSIKSSFFNISAAQEVGLVARPPPHFRVDSRRREGQAEPHLEVGGFDFKKIDMGLESDLLTESACYDPCLDESGVPAPPCLSDPLLLSVLENLTTPEKARSGATKMKLVGTCLLLIIKGLAVDPTLYKRPVNPGCLTLSYLAAVGTPSKGPLSSDNGTEALRNQTSTLGILLSQRLQDQDSELERTPSLLSVEPLFIEAVERLRRRLGSTERELDLNGLLSSHYLNGKRDPHIQNVQGDGLHILAYGVTLASLSSFENVVAYLVETVDLAIPLSFVVTPESAREVMRSDLVMNN